MGAPKNIVESVNFISEEDLLVQELDKRLSFDVVSLQGTEQARGCAKCMEVCGCLVVGCPCNETKHVTSCGVRG